MDTSANIVFLGVGSAFTTSEYYQSNLLVTAESGKKLLVDCGSDARFSLAEWALNRGIPSPVIDAVYTSHLHADHIGGLEWLAFSSYFNPNAPKPKLFAVDDVLNLLWSDALRGGLGYINDKMMILSDYFDIQPLLPDESFIWEGIRFTNLRMLHVRNSYRNVHSYGLVIKRVDGGPAYLFSSDVLFDSGLVNQLKIWEPKVNFFFQDTETMPFRTNVHAHYEDLCTLPDPIRQKMWLYHYNPKPLFMPQNDGFLGFVKKGQIFNL